MLACRAAAFLLVVLLAAVPAALLVPSSAWRDNTRPEPVTLSIQHVPWVAASLPSGRVLVVGGNNFSPGGSDTAVEYDESSAAWVHGTYTLTPHNQHTATLLSDGKVLVVGYDGAEVYDATVFP